MELRIYVTYRIIAISSEKELSKLLQAGPRTFLACEGELAGGSFQPPLSRLDTRVSSPTLRHHPSSCKSKQRKLDTQLNSLSGQSHAKPCAPTSINPGDCALTRYVIHIRWVWSQGPAKAVPFLLHDCFVMIGYTMLLTSKLRSGRVISSDISRLPNRSLLWGYRHLYYGMDSFSRPSSFLLGTAMLISYSLSLLL